MLSSSAVLLVLGDKQVGRVVQDTVSFNNKGELFERDEAIRNASLSAMMFMLSAKDAETVEQILNIDDQFEVVMIITQRAEGRAPEIYKCVC